MHVNRTGAGFHRDNRREARFGRAEARRWAIEESALADPGHEEGSDHRSPQSDDRTPPQSG